MEEPRVEIRLTNVWMYIQGSISDDLKEAIQAKMSYVVPGFKYMPQYKQQKAIADAQGIEPPWDGTRTVARRAKFGGLVAPSGLFSYLKETLNDHGVTYSVSDQRLPTTASAGWSTEGLVLRDYQEKVKEISLGRQRGVIKIATAGGKTEQVIAILVEASVFPSIFYVPSCDLLEQTYDRFMKYLRYNGQPAAIGRIGAGHFDIQPITIATVQSCERALSGKATKFDEESDTDETKFSEQQRKQIEELVKEAQFAYVDECHHTSSDTIQTIMNNSHKARFRFGGSASPWRDDGLDILIEACFGKRLCDIDASFLICQGYLVRPHITFNHFRQFLGASSNYQSVYTKFVVENDVRNNWIAQRAAFHIDQGRPTIILVKWSRHAERLQALIPSAQVLTSSGTMAKKPEKRKEVLDLMRERKLMCIIGTTLLDEGVDIPAAGAGIFAGGGKSSTRALQRVGRFIRKDTADPLKDTAYIEEFYDCCRFLDHHARARRKMLSTERQFVIEDNKATLVL